MSHSGKHSINEVIGEVTRTLIPSSTKNELRQRTCEQFAASELYFFAWIGRYNPEKEEVIPIASAGIAENPLHGITLTEESPQAELTGEAVRTQEVTVGQNLVDDPPYEEWRDHALNHDYQAYAVIPLVYEETLHGVLHLATNRPQGFGAAEREPLAELGITIAYALENAEPPANTKRTEREKANSNLAKVTPDSEQERRLYKTIISSTPDLVYAFDLDYRFIFANNALLEMWGQSYEESIGKTLLEVGYEPWHAEMHEREIDQVVETKEPIRGEVAFDHAELGHRIYDYIFAPVLNEDREVEAVAGTTRDVTERKETEEALQKSEERFRALVNASSDVVYRMSSDWSEMYRLEGQGSIADTNEPTSDWLDKYIHPDDQERVLEGINEAIETKSIFEMEHRVKQDDGGLGWTLSRAVPRLDEDGGIIEWVGMASDITERKEHERALRDAKAQLEAATEAAAVGTWEWYVQEDRMVMDQSFARRFGIDPDEARDGISLDRYISAIHEDDRERIEAKVDEALDSCGEYEEEYRVRNDEGELRWVVARGRAECDEDGTPLTFPGAVTDITERKEYEHKLEESNERLEQFAYAASHDLQEPLRMVTSYLQLLENRYSDELDEDAEEFIEFAVDGANRMREMIEGLLQYSRVDTRGNPFEAVNLDAVFADVRQDLKVKIEESGAEITNEELPLVYGDRSQLNQVFQNLLDNALEYSGDASPRIHVAAEREGTDWILSVEDEGIGIPQEDADRVFEVFQSLQSHEDTGTGIGLALCERIVERHGGDIWVNSEDGEGATFSFKLPAAEETDE